MINVDEDEDDDQGQFEKIGWSDYVLSLALQICRLVSNRSAQIYY